MKKIINQKRYDTNTAEGVAFINNGLSFDDFNFWSETLYRKKTGEYFLYCMGGANSIYGVWRGNTGTAGEQIKPLTYEQAKSWAEEHLDGDEYEKIFGAIIENDDMVNMTFTLPQSTIEKLRRLSSQTGKTYGEIITDALK